MNQEPNRHDQGTTSIGKGSQPVVIKKNPNTWYVSIYYPQQEKTGHYSRRSRTFASESEAKRFAAAKFETGAEVTAGTLNPVAPKRIVAPMGIENWLSEAEPPDE